MFIAFTTTVIFFLEITYFDSGDVNIFNEFSHSIRKVNKILPYILQLIKFLKLQKN